MSKTVKKNNKLKRAITISIVLHVVLFILMIFSSFDKGTKKLTYENQLIMDAVMVDQDILAHNYNFQQQWQNNAKYVEKQRETQEQNQPSELRKKHIIELKNLKQLERQPQIQEALHERTEKKRLIKKVANKKVDQPQKIEVVAAKTKNNEQTKKITESVKQIIDIQKKIKAETTKNPALEAIKNKYTKNINNPLDTLGLDRRRDRYKEKRKNIFLDEKNDAKSRQLSADINKYARQIKAAIESHFYNASSYSGKTCLLRIKLAPDGALLDIQSEGGYPALCTAAISAARQARIPKPPSQDIYEIFKNVPLYFRP